MTCHECIAQATEFIDDTLSPLERARHAMHIQKCASCARYHRVLGRSLGLARDMDDIEPSPGFKGQLHRRLRGLEEERVRRQRAVMSGATVVIALAALMALAAWGPVWEDAFRARQDAAQLVEDRRPGLPPDLAPTDWWYPGPLAAPVTPAVNRAATFPGPYSPVVVQPPMVNGAGTAALSGAGE